MGSVAKCCLPYNIKSPHYCFTVFYALWVRAKWWSSNFVTTHLCKHDFPSGREQSWFWWDVWYDNDAALSLFQSVIFDQSSHEKYERDDLHFTAFQFSSPLNFSFTHQNYIFSFKFMRLKCLGPSVPQELLINLDSMNMTILNSMSSVNEMVSSMLWPVTVTHHLRYSAAGDVVIRLYLPPGYTDRETHHKYPLIVSM